MHNEARKVSVLSKPTVIPYLFLQTFPVNTNPSAMKLGNKAIVDKYTYNNKKSKASQKPIVTVSRKAAQFYRSLIHPDGFCWIMG